MMLEWLGETHGSRETAAAGRLIRNAVDAAFAPGTLAPFELGGRAGTRAITDAVMAALG
jgi:3-isopropylmalate dehydrogenase